MAGVRHRKAPVTFFAGRQAWGEFFLVAGARLALGQFSVSVPVPGEVRE
jgi:hypothetical protein